MACYEQWKAFLPYYQLALVMGEATVNSGISGGEVGGDCPMRDGNKNMILYGPLGTGKTYNTVTYALSIIKNQSPQLPRVDYLLINHFMYP
jgi:hypothetical protein